MLASDERSDDAPSADTTSSGPCSAAATNPDETVRRAAHETWRGSAQRVTRAWNAWLAADRAERGGRYRAYVEVLAEEDRAAARVERMLQFADSESKRSQTTAEAEAP